MKQSLTQTAIEAARPRSKAYEIRDTKLSGFLVRVQPSGRKTYYCEYKRGGRVKIGLFGVLSTKQARDHAQAIIFRYLQGDDPAERRKQKKAAMTYREYLDRIYFPWVDANLKSAYEYKRVINANCQPLMSTGLKDFEALKVHAWRMKLIAEGKTPNTVNRIYTNFRASLSKAEEIGLIDKHPLRKLKPIKSPDNSRSRYLTADEERRLRDALDVREAKKRTARKSANQWRTERGYESFTNSNELYFMDHLKPMVILSMNTGMRRGEVFKLKWSSVDFEARQITVEASTAKNGRSRYIPMNTEAFQTLSLWRDQKENKSEYVFPNKGGRPFNTIKKGWAKVLKSAQIEDFRWHDLRHHFASKLVMADVRLNVVRELLGHTSFAMTLRYAHLSKEKMVAAVELLNGGLPLDGDC